MVNKSLKVGFELKKVAERLLKPVHGSGWEIRRLEELKFLDRDADRFLGMLNGDKDGFERDIARFCEILRSPVPQEKEEELRDFYSCFSEKLQKLMVPFPVSTTVNGSHAKNGNLPEPPAARIKGEKLWEQSLSTELIRASLSWDGKTLAACAHDGRLFILDAKSGKVILDHQFPRRASSLGFAPTGRAMVMGCGYGTSGEVFLFDLRSKSAHSLCEMGSPVTLVALSPDWSRFAAGCNDGHLYGIEIKSKEILFHEKLGNCVTAIGSSRKGSLAVGWSNGLLSIRDEKWNKTGEAKLKGYLVSAAFTGDGKQLVAASDYGNVYRLHPSDGTILHRYRSDSALQALAISPRGDLLLTGLLDGKVMDPETEKPLLEGHSPVIALAFSPDAKRVIACGSGGNIVAFK